MANKSNVYKKKIENFWYYYKIHFIVGVFVVISLGMILKDCAANVSPDVTITYIGEHVVRNTVSNKLENYLLEEELIEDANNDGETALFFQTLTVSNEIRSEQDMAMQEKIMLVLAAGDSQVYLLDRMQFERFVRQGVFASLDHLAQEYNLDLKQNPEVKLAIEDIFIVKEDEEKEGKTQREEYVYAFPIENNTLLQELGFETQGMYIALGVERQRRRPRESDYIKYQNGYAVLKEIIKHN